MKIDIRAIHFDLTEEIRNYAAEKIGRLDKYYKNIIATEVKLEEHEGVRADQNRFSCKVRVEIPGKDIHAEENGQDLHEAIDLAEQDLSRQLRKVKEKNNPKKLARAKEAIRRFFGKEEE